MHDFTRSRADRASTVMGRAARLPTFFLFAFVATMASALAIRTVDAASFQGPTAAPPGNNIPVTVWNRAATAGQQTSAGIDIDGNAGAGNYGINVGSSTLNLPAAKNLFYANVLAGSAGNLLLLSASGVDKLKVTAAGDLTSTGSANFIGPVSFGGVTTNLGNAAGGQNLLYSVTPYANTHPADMLVKLQTYVAPATYVDRFTVDRDGNVAASGGLTVGTLTTNGNLKSNACFGGTLVGLTPSSYHGGLGNVGSYYSANGFCATAYAGSHVCSTQEVLESIKCGGPADPIKTIVGQFAWLNGGPPGDPGKKLDDCGSWSDNTAASFGRIWQFNNVLTGGVGTVTSCNIPIGAKFACCK